VKDGKRRYDGFVVERPAVSTQLPVLDWYLSDADAQWLAENRGSKEYVPAVLVVDGRVIDGVEVRNQGGATSAFSIKPNFKFKLPGQQTIAEPFFDAPVDELVIDADFEDPTSAIGRTAWSLMAEAGVPRRRAATGRVERNGAFFGVFQLYQEYDGTWFDQLPYEMASFYEGESGRADLLDEGDPAALAERWEQTEGDGTAAELTELVAAVDRSAGPQRVDAVVDRFDVPRLVDLIAMSKLVQHLDTGRTNMDLVWGADGRWRIIPNDLDLTLGLRGRTRYQGFVPTPLTSVTSLLSTEGELADQVARRTRTLADEWFEDDRILDDVRARVDAMRPDLELDRQRWVYDRISPDEGLADLADFLETQRAVLDGWTATGVIPGPGTEGTEVRVSELAAHGSADDFVELANPDRARSIDVSGWTLGGAATATLPGGSVLAPGARLVVPASAAAVAARRRGTVVSGELDAALPPAGGTLVVRDAEGGVVDQVTWRTTGGWPDPGSSGRSIEARSLDAGRALPSGWALSPDAGGTPGAAGASERGLSVRVDAGVEAGPIGAPLPIAVVIANAGPGARTGVEVDGPGTCDRSVDAIPPGGVVVLHCEGASTQALGFEPLRTVVRAAEEPDGVVDAPVVRHVPESILPGVPELLQVRLEANRIRVGYRATGAASEPGEAPWRVEAVAVPSGAGEGRGAVVGAGTA
ncbi:MAG TPA: CotH kinase family protein, partial [Acidimicrobiales bacterium]|nr:CotH kinase family protein [Acidimicrobiales bacterium]